MIKYYYYVTKPFTIQSGLGQSVFSVPSCIGFLLVLKEISSQDLQPKLKKENST